jgi:hypothetical protein
MGGARRCCVIRDLELGASRMEAMSRLRIGRPGAFSRSVIVWPVLLVAVIGLGVQVAYATHETVTRVRHRNEEGEAAVAIRLARMIPPGAKYAATSLSGRTFARYALYPRRPVHVRFVGESEPEIRAALSAAGVEYVLVTPPVTRRSLRGPAAWFDVVARHRHPNVLLLRITR